MGGQHCTHSTNLSCSCRHCRAAQQGSATVADSHHPEDGQAARCPHTLRLHTHSSDHQVVLWMFLKYEILSLEYEPLTDIYNQSQFFISTGDTDSEKLQLNNKIIRGKTCSLTNLCTILLSVQLYTCTNQDEFISCPHHITTH